MAKGLNQVKVNLLFSADTGQAKAQLQDLKNQLNNLMTLTGSSGSKLPVTNQIIEATNAASQLKASLEQATNVNTGRLDLSKFSQSLKSSGMNLKQYAASLNNLGPQGQKAFLSVAQAIVTAETPMRRTNALAKEMFNTLQNTARWQLSSSILHGFMGAVQEAYGYAQDLNESLNNIRIVTGKSVDEMKDFAEYANKAAKSLNVSTTEFTDAALIFYQQGLSGDAVMERAAVVSKMANVSRQSAQVVSDQMTAVWNNFNDGSKSLEYYADVMTALGAATASSTDEIAQGLEKFAAIADTVGLSYEYATSALATVTAETRQSADVVGTAFKTIFARLEGLSLGDTLEDGTDLNKYSTALKTVGVEIKDASGEMRSMDSILNDLGNRWEDLAQDEKIALAQTVAGVRQYNQLISLMDNWDTFQDNLTTANTASGSLDQQADIYAESWEAAQQRVQTSAEQVYSQLLDDEFFIKLSNMLADLIQGFSKFTKAIGGLPGLLGLIGALGTQIFKKELAEGIDNLAYNFKVRTGVIKKETEALKDSAVQALEQLKSRPGISQSEIMEIEMMQEQVTYSRKLQEMSESLDSTQRQHLTTLMETTKQYGLMAIEAQKAAEAAKIDKDQAGEDIVEIAKKQARKKVLENEEYQKGSVEKKRQMLEEADKRAQTTGEAHSRQAEEIGYTNEVFETIEEGEISSDMFDEFNQAKKLGGMRKIYEKEDYKDLNEIYELLKGHIEKLKELEAERKELEEKIASGEIKNPEAVRQTEERIQQIEKQEEEVKKKAEKAREEHYSDPEDDKGQARREKRDKRRRKADSALTTRAGGDEETEKAMRKKVKLTQEDMKAQKKAQKATAASAKQNKNLAKSFNTVSKSMKSFGQKFTSAANTVSMLTMGLTSLKSALESLSDPDMSPLEKLSGLAMSIGMVIPGLVKIFGTLTGAISRNNTIVGINSALLANNGKAISAATSLKIAETLADKELNEEQKEEAITKLLLTQMTKEEVDAIKEKTGSTLVSIFTKKIDNATEESSIKVRMKSIAATLKQTAANGTGVIAKLADAAANVIATMTAWPLAIVVLVIVAAVLALVAIVLVVIAVFNKWKAAMPTEQLKKANEELKRTSEEMEKAKEASEKLKESIKGYEEAVDSLHGLTKGTEEYNEALQKANDAARELINNNPELAGKYSFNAETGLIEFDDKALEDMQELQNKRYTSALADQTHAQNEVLQAKNYGAAFDASGSWGTPEGLGIALTMLTGGLGGLLLEAKTMSDNAQQDAINNLAENMNKYNGNFEKARNSLSASDQALIDSLGMTDSELSALAQEMANNTQAILENNKILIGQALQDNELYQRFADEEGYTDLIAGQFQKDVDAEVESGETSKLKGKKLEEEYAKLKGYTRTGSGTFTDSEGNEIKDISDESMRVAIANDKVLNNIDNNIGDYNKDYANFKSREKQLSANINSAEDFEAYKEQMMKEFGDKYGTAAVESYIAQSTSKVGTDGKTIADYNNRDRLVSSMSGINISDEAKNKIADELFNGDYTEEQIEAAIAGAAESDSVTDLKRNISLGLVEGSVQGLENSVEQVKGIMEEASKAGNFTTEQLNQMTANEDFKQFLEDQGKDLQEFMNDSFGDQYNLMQDFYQQSNEQLYEALEAQQEIYINSIEDVYAAAANGTMAIEDAVYEVERLLNKIDEVNNKRIEMAMDWSEVDQAVSGFDNLSKLNKAMLSDTYKLGNSYQLTAKQAREWVEVYPELMDQATITADGIYQLNESVVKDYIAQQEAETKADIERQKQKLQMQRNDLETQLETLKAEKQMWAQTKTSEVKIEALSKEQLIRLRSNYTQYFIEAGMTEAEASNAALKAMGMSQEQYYSAVTGMAAQSGNKIIEFFKDVAEKVMNFINSIIAAIDSWDGETEIEVDLSLNTNIDDSIDGFYDEGGMLDRINKDLEDQIYNTEEAIREIDRQMKYLDAVYNGGLTGWMNEDLGSQDKNKLKRELDKEIERYHVINQQIERQEKALSRLGKAKDKAYGPAKLKYMQQEIGMLEDMASMEEQRLAQMKDGLAFDQGIMLGHGAQLDENGVILNYDQLIMEKLQAKQQAQLSGNEADIEAAEQAYDDFMEDLERYEESLSAYEDQLEAVQDAQDAILTTKLETIQYEVEYKIDIVSDDLEYLDYLLGKIEDDAFAAAQKIALLTDETNALIEQGEAYQKGIDDLFAVHNVNPEDLGSMSDEDFEAAGFTEADLEQLREYQAGLIETAQAIQDKKDAVEDSLEELYDGWNERIESQIAKIEHASAVLENYRNIVDTVGKGTFGFDTQTMLKLTRKQIEAANANTRALKDQYDANRDALTEAQKALADAQAAAQADPENQALQDDVKYWEDQVQKTSDKVDELELSYKEALVNSLSLIAEEYQQTIDAAVEYFNQAVSKNGKDLQQLMETYNRSNEVDDRYIDGYEKMYELNKLSRDLDKKLAKTNSLAEQQALIKMLEKVNAYKEEGVEMSEYELKALQAEVELEQARIAMEEAQNAKTQVVRRRDNEGNWGYVYTANEDKTADAIGNYEQKLYNAEKVTDEFLDSVGEKILEAQEAMATAVAEIMADTTLSAEEQAARVAEIQDHYTAQINYYYDQMGIALDNNRTLLAEEIIYRTDWNTMNEDIDREMFANLATIRQSDYESREAYYQAIEERTGLSREQILALEEQGVLDHANAIGEKMAANLELQDSFTDTKYAQATEYDDMKQAQDDFVDATNTLVDSCKVAYGNYKDAVDEAMKAADTSVDEFVENFDKNTTAVANDAKKAGKAVEQMRKDMANDYSKAVTSVRNFQTKFSGYMKKIDDSIKATKGLIDQLITRLKNLDAKYKESQTITSTPINYTSNGGSGGGGGGGGSGGGGGGSGGGNDNKPITYKDVKTYPTKSVTQWCIGGWDEDLKLGKDNPIKLDGKDCVYIVEYDGYVATSDIRWDKPFSSDNKAYTPSLHKDYGSKDQWMVKQGATVYTGETKIEKVAQYNTGGYTGNWGAEGRMAMLHQKELVLNAQDTENFLMATNILRNIVSQIELNSLNKMFDLNKMSTALSANLGNNFEQNVTIQAEFPNATNHNEIEEAFNNLVNRASQYANRKQ